MWVEKYLHPDLVKGRFMGKRISVDLWAREFVLRKASSFWTRGWQTYEPKISCIEQTHIHSEPVEWKPMGRIEMFENVCIFVGRYKPVMGWDWMRWLFLLSLDCIEGIHKTIMKTSFIAELSLWIIVRTVPTINWGQLQPMGRTRFLQTRDTIEPTVSVSLYLQMYACGCMCVLMPKFMFVCQTLCLFCFHVFLFASLLACLSAYV